MSFVTTSKFAKRADQEHVNVAGAAFKMVEHLSREGSLRNDPAIGKALVSNESFSADIEQAAFKMLGDVQASVESFFKMDGAKLGVKVTPQQQEAVSFALASAMAPKDSLARRVAMKGMKGSNAFEVFIPDNSGLDPAKLGQRSMEAYDTKPNDETLNFTAAFALATATQNRFGEMFYKTVNLSPDQYAIEMEIPLISVYDQVRYELEKRLTDYNRRNIVNAEIDATILKNDTLKIIPVVRAQTADAFVDPALVAPYAATTDEGEAIQTAPLKTNYRTSLFRLALTDTQLAKGVLDQTDALDPGAVLKGVYVVFSNADGSKKEVVRFDTSNSPLNQFTEALQGQTRRMDLQFTTDSAMIGPNTTLFNNAATQLLGAFQGASANTAWLSFSVRGDINLQDSSYEIITGSIVVNTIKNINGVSLDVTDAGQAAMVTLLEGGKIIGVDIDVRRVNSNLRELGQLADFNTYRQIYGVSLGSPLSVQRPITNGDAQDALHAAALSYLCKVRQSNLAVTQLLSEVDTLRQYAKRSDVIGRQPEIMGISSYLIEPVLQEVSIDLLKAVTTTAQHERYSDITAILTDTCKIMAYKLWQLSNWQAAANLLEGTEAQLPVVKLGTDMVLTQYLMVEGDTRTMGPDFSYEKAWTPDSRVRGKIFIALGYPSNNPGVPHPLDHGMMLNKPEVVAALNLSRTSHSRELIVHPSFRHIPLCPILGVLTVTNLQEALSQQAVLGVEVTNATAFLDNDATTTP
ncbi:putative major head protein [Burkholderia phage FLC6]|nr:putative major head protein [Burkholderia phage FLC6]